MYIAPDAIMLPMKVKEVGEFELIELMAQVFRREPQDFLRSGSASRLSVGIGDDAAVWRESTGGFTIATTDAMVEGVHFTAATTGWYDLGWKAMASNISDIAGMGGRPRYALTVLATSGDRDVEEILELCRGMADVASRYGAAVVGGDTVSSPITMISITLIGEATGNDATGAASLLSRYEAHPGDVIAVTGFLGSSAGGLDLLMNSPSPVPDQLAPLVDAHRQPMPRVAEGLALVDAGVRCGMDLSDGLAGDLARICRASGVSAEIQAEGLPIDPLLRRTFGVRAVDLALSGGEDYELVCIAPAGIMAAAQKSLSDMKTPLTVVGRVSAAVPGQPPVMIAGPDGRLSPPPRSGWEHFSAGSDTSDSAARG